MTDKQIIIDGCNVNGCEWYTQGATGMICADWHISNDCSQNPNCYYKQLQRKEQECEELKEKFQNMKKSRDVALKEYNEEFEYKRQITVEHLEQKKELLKQLNQLKAENEELKKCYKNNSALLDFEETNTTKLVNKVMKLEKILTEIKEIVEKGFKSSQLTKLVLDLILQKISEVDDERSCDFL